MGDESTLKIEVSSTGAGSSASASSSSPVDTFASRQAAQAEKSRAFGEAERRRQNEKETEERLAAKERQRRKQADLQERDESWLARRDARDAKRAEAAKAKADAIQNRDEDYAERQALREKKEKALADKRAAAEQAKNEDYAERQARQDAAKKEQDRLRKFWNNPNNVAQGMIQRQQFGAAVRGSYMAQRFGLGPDNPITKLASQANVLAGRLQPLIGVAGALYGAWKAARQNLMDEANKVRYLSADLKMQEIVNKMRNMRTDKEIADKYGERMATLEDRENRQQNAWRLIGTKVSSAIDSALKPVLEPLEEGYTQFLEYLAGSNKSSDKTNKYLQELTGYSKQQLEEMGVKAGMRDSIAQAMGNAEKVLATLGADGIFAGDDDVTNKIFKSGFVPDNNWNQDNPGLLPVPAFWRDR